MPNRVASYLKFSIPIIIPFLLLIFFAQIAGFSLDSSFTYFSGLCTQSSAAKNEYIRFILLNDKNEPLGCKKIRVAAEDDICLDSPCPEYTTFFRGKTSQDGSILIPKKKFSPQAISYAEGPREYINNKKGYLFHIQGQLNNSDMFYEKIVASENHEIILYKLPDSDCETPTDDYQRNFCD